ncbi:MAG TPA: S9 family peptidase [Terriglobales bacterium]|nr:S9 family peptidase [Terriglobales bacterium]
MRTSACFVILILMSTVTLAQQLATPKFVTDPAELKSIPNLNVQKFTVEKLFMTRAIGGTAWSPDGKSIAFMSNISGRMNLWTVPAEGGWPMQLTVSEQRQFSPAWSPDGKWIAYMSDHNGDEQWDIFVVSPLSGEVINLTQTPEIAEEDPQWSPDGRLLAYMVKPKTSSTFEIDAMDFTTHEVRHLTSGTPKDRGNVSPLWSRDGKWLAYTQVQAKGTDSDIYVVEVATSRSTRLTPHSGEQLYTVNDWSPDGKKLLITSNAGNGYENVGLLDIANKKIDWLTQDKWEIQGGNFSPDGRTATWTANVDGNSDIYFHDLTSGKTEVLPLPAGVNELGGHENAFTHDGSRLLYIHNGPNAPADAWVYNLAGKRSQQITHSLVAGVRGADMVEPYLVHYPSRDGKFQISAFVYVPHNLPPNRQSPAVVYVHGGPTSQTVNLFNRGIQYLVNQGYLIIAPNYRGSTGYGKEFQQANLFDMGGGDLQDVLAAADWIKRSAYVDPKKLVIMGGSYGGYMTMMAVTKAPEVWGAGVAIVPFVNYFTEVQNEDPVLREMDLATMGDPVKNKALWEDRSPIFFVDRIKAPLLILAGAHDPRCPQSEAQQVADAIQKRGGVVDLKIYEDEGHGFSRVPNQIDSWKRISDFLQAHVPPADCGCSLND